MRKHKPSGWRNMQFAIRDVRQWSMGLDAELWRPAVYIKAMNALPPHVQERAGEESTNRGREGLRLGEALNN